MLNIEIRAIAVNLALEDVRLAYVTGECEVKDTKSGPVKIKRIAGKYSFTKIKSGEVIRDNLSGFQATEFLADIYDVRVKQ